MSVVYRSTFLRSDGIQVTVVNSEWESVGLGYLMPDGEVWKTTGSFWAVRASDDFPAADGFIQDGGAFYLECVRNLGRSQDAVAAALAGLDVVPIGAGI